MVLEWVVAGATLVLAIAIGGNNAAAAMGAAYGAAIRTRREALLIVAIFFTLGAILAGRGVTISIAQGYLDSRHLQGNLLVTLSVVGVSAFFILLTNILRSPIATTHATIFALAGVGLYTTSLHGDFFFKNLAWWAVSPLLSLTGGYLFARYIHPRLLERIADLPSEERINRLLGLLVTGSGAYIAFSIGANSVGKAVGPAVGFGSDPLLMVALGGLAMSGGAILMGFRVIQTVGKEIAEICAIRASGVEAIAATIIILSSTLGYPLSVTHTLTSSVIGLNCAKQGFRETVKSKTVKRIILLWFIVPGLATGITYGILAMAGMKP
ncbi:MAG: inorganic phosphate transporter [Euryarchaeota archaeon]|nr:inorganic phosphate transporter [Euryarchaeota archaeon]